MSHDEELEHLDRKRHRAQKIRRVGFWVLVVCLIAAVAYALTSGADRERRINALQEQAQSSDSAATQVAEEKQRQARSITELCEAGAIEQDAAGKAVCEDAAESAQEDPQEAITQAKAGPQGPRGATGPTGPRGPAGPTGPVGEDGEAGPPGEDGADGATGSEGEPGETGPTGEQGDTGPAGEDGATGDTGPAGTDGATGPAGPPGEQGPQGDTGPAGPVGPAGPPGEDGTDGRGIASITCGTDDQWVVTYTDGETETVTGPCRVTAEPEPTDTPSDEPSEPTPEEATP